MKSLNLLRDVLVLAAMVVIFTVCVERASAEFVDGPATNLGPVINTSAYEGDPTVTPDGLELYFASARNGSKGRSDIWMSKRAAPNEPWSEPVNFDNPMYIDPRINSTDNESTPTISADGLELYFSSDRGDSVNGNDPWDQWNDPWGQSDYDLYVTKRASRGEPWGSAENLRLVNSLEYDEGYPYLSADGLKLYFYSSRPRDSHNTVFIQSDVWVSTRASKDDNWSNPTQVGTYTIYNANTGLYEEEGEDIDVRQGARIFSVDGEYFRIFSVYKQDDYGDLWQVQIHPVLDFNGDGIVDMEDLSRLTDYWEQEESSVDIAPGPYGDGIIDFNDMDLLLDYWEQEVNDVSLIANWKLDETDGNIAYDSAGGYDGTVYGEPLWQPDGGVIGGALEFDGIDDHIAIEHSLPDSEFDSFSIIAWIKGGAPGQVIFSQYPRANWLMAGDLGGLKTVLETSGGGRSEDWDLQSQTVITDGQWHRIVFSWNEGYEKEYGYNTILYIDGREESTGWGESLDFFTNDMLIGAGRDYQPDQPQSLWTGLIDDVRIYKRAVKP